MKNNESGPSWTMDKSKVFKMREVCRFHVNMDLTVI